MSKKVEGPCEDLTYRIIGAAMALHRRLGPGQKEDVYRVTINGCLSPTGLMYNRRTS